MLSGTTGSSCTFPAPAPQSTFPPRALVPFSGEWGYKSSSRPTATGMRLLLDPFNEQSQGTCIHSQPHLFLDRHIYQKSSLHQYLHSRVHSGFFFFHTRTPCSRLFWGSTYHPSDHVQAARAEAPLRWSGHAPTFRSLVHTHVQCWLLPPCLLHPKSSIVLGDFKGQMGTTENSWLFRGCLFPSDSLHLLPYFSHLLPWSQPVPWHENALLPDFCFSSSRAKHSLLLPNPSSS